MLHPLNLTFFSIVKLKYQNQVRDLCALDNFTNYTNYNNVQNENMDDKITLQIFLVLQL